MDSTPIAATPPTALAAPHLGLAREGSPALHATVPAFLLLLAVLSVLFVDVPLASRLKGRSLPDGIDKFLEAAEHFGTFYGQILAFLLIATLDPAGRRRIVRLAGAAWSAGLAANLIKLCVARTRPKHFDFESLTAGHGFLGLAPGLSGGSRIQGFPSAHTATAVGFAVALACVYPRGRNAFYALAALVGLQRIATCSHFASDVFAGAIVGWVVGLAWTSSNALTSRLDSFEALST